MNVRIAGVEEMLGKKKKNETRSPKTTKQINSIKNIENSNNNHKTSQLHLPSFIMATRLKQKLLENEKKKRHPKFINSCIRHHQVTVYRRFRLWVALAMFSIVFCQCCVGGDVPKSQMLKHLGEELEICFKSLVGFLDSKRKVGSVFK